ncbi:MAG: 23S rRNA (pseudouridine(1915)-N(3))-methyltransferase RlmH [Clostridia bacterium]|nr:23S rRNA (pseudouridine(1915)-N(3))-methyltransferase RlmH [Clostridia bacterium]
MNAVTVLHVGDFKESFFRDAESEYVRRIRPFCGYATVALREECTHGENSEKLIIRALEKEAEQIRAHIPPRAFTVALCIEGTQYDSEEFARLLYECERPVCFIIGSSFGLDPALKKQCDLRLSFSEMTFPHMLARVMLAEQVYRACMINSGRRYHK